MEPSDIEKQIDRFNKYLTQDPENLRLICQLAQLNLQLNNLEEARTILNNGLNLFPANDELLFIYSNILLTENKYNEAIITLRKIGTTNPAVQFNIAYALLFNQEYEAAIKIFTSLIDLDENFQNLKYWTGRCHYYLGDLDNAEKYLYEFLEDNPDNSNALGTLALLKLDQKQFREAKELADAAISLSPDNMEASTTLGNLCLNEHDHQGASEFFTSTLNTQPDNGRAWYGLGLANLINHDIASAISNLENATAHIPKHLGTWHSLAWAQMINDDLAGARLTLEKAMMIDRNFGETHGAIALLDILSGNTEGAKEGLKRALKLDNMSFSARFAQSLLLQKTNPDRAKQIVHGILSYKINSEESLIDILSKNNIHLKY
jgi:tetratricopeptide (TPR) repeat protein